jgi:gluconolactonase
MNAAGATQASQSLANVEVYDAGLYEVLGADPQLERVAAGFGFTEGPVWQFDCLLFSDIPNNRIARWRRLPEGPEVTTYARGMANGLTLDSSGRVLVAEHWGRCVSRVEGDGTRIVLADRFQNKRLNSPNDIVTDSKGAIYFTDPPMGVRQHRPGASRSAGWWNANIPEKEQPVNGVYRLDPSGHLTLVASDFALPNGLAFSPDESLLYVDDSAYNHVRVFSVRNDGSLTGGNVLFDMRSDGPGEADGLKVDKQGNIFCTGPGGIWVCQHRGKPLGRIILPETPANVAWGEDGSALFVTADSSVYRLQTKTSGVVFS